jgi:CO/xanthine dehydrogenase Mo-binding subunit
VTTRAKWGATREGKLTAAEMEIIADAGAYLYTSNKVMGNTTVVCTGPYFIPHVKVDTYAAYTNNIPTGAFRGFGAPPFLRLAPAILAAIHDATGIWMDELPVTPERMWQALQHKQELSDHGTNS